MTERPDGSDLFLSRSFWHNERVSVQFEYRSEGGGGRDIKTDIESMDKELPVFKGVPGARGAPKKYDWTFRFRCRRHRPRKQLGIGRESVGNNCPVQIRMRKLVSCDVVEVEYEWCHNHADSAQARSKLPLGKNELEWTKAKIASGQDWKAVRSQLRLSKEALDLVCSRSYLMYHCHSPSLFFAFSLFLSLNFFRFPALSSPPPSVPVAFLTLLFLPFLFLRIVSFPCQSL